MKINPDCIRDILITCEEKIIMNDDGEIECITEKTVLNQFPKYSLADIKYHIKYLKEYGLINAYIISSDNASFISSEIYDLTPYGHEFLNNIKNDNIWSKTKDTSKKIGSSSLTILKEISTALLTELIKVHML